MVRPRCLAVRERQGDAQRNKVTGAPVNGDKNDALNGASELTAGLGRKPRSIGATRDIQECGRAEIAAAEGKQAAR